MRFTLLFAVQAEQLGTGHAVMQAKPLLGSEKGTVMVLCGDTPLLTGQLLEKLYNEHKASGAKATVLTAIMPDVLRIVLFPRLWSIRMLLRKSAK